MQYDLKIPGTPAPLEGAEQAALVQWCDHYAKARYPGVERIYAVPNGAWLGGNRQARFAQMTKLKRQGLRPGMCDLVLPVPRGPYHGMYLEMKRTKGGSVSDEQKDWLSYLRGQGYHAGAYKGWASASEAIIAYYRQPDSAEYRYHLWATAHHYRWPNTGGCMPEWAQLPEDQQRIWRAVLATPVLVTPEVSAFLGKVRA